MRNTVRSDGTVIDYTGALCIKSFLRWTAFILYLRQIDYAGTRVLLSVAFLGDKLIINLSLFPIKLNGTKARKITAKFKLL